MKKIKLRQPTQKEIIQNHLMHNKKITSLECILKYNIIDLQGVIRDLKNEGLDIYIVAGLRIVLHTRVTKNIL